MCNYILNKVLKIMAEENSEQKNITFDVTVDNKEPKYKLVK